MAKNFTLFAASFLLFAAYAQPALAGATDSKFLNGAGIFRALVTTTAPKSDPRLTGVWTTVQKDYSIVFLADGRRPVAPNGNKRFSCLEGFPALRIRGKLL